MPAIAFSKLSDPLETSRELSSLKGSPRLNDNSEREEIALYLAQMTGELAALARSAHYDLLGYFLEMARIEAKGHAGVLKTPN
jgi:dsDNA-binding SOS-regulon protein